MRAASGPPQAASARACSLTTW